MVRGSHCRHLFVLLKLAELGAHRRTARVSTETLAKDLGLSQQTASRYLIELEQRKWIDKTVTTAGSLVRITSLGFKELSNLYATLKTIMNVSAPDSITLEGTVFTGLGEGAYYIMKDNYRCQFIEKLGFDPYPGTLNLRLVSEYDLEKRRELESTSSITLQGFKNHDRSFGVVKCYPVIVNNEVKGALISALRSHYDASVLEIVAPKELRKSLRLRDGDKVQVEVLTLP